MLAKTSEDYDKNKIFSDTHYQTTETEWVIAKNSVRSSESSPKIQLPYIKCHNILKERFLKRGFGEKEIREDKNISSQ